jgi:hypothetical protein
MVEYLVDMIRRTGYVVMRDKGNAGKYRMVKYA